MPRPMNDQLLRGPRIIRQQPQELSNSLGSDQIIAPTGNVVTDVNCAVVTLWDIYPGDTTIFFVGTRSGTPTGVVSVSGVPASCTVEILKFDNGGSPSTSIVRVYWQEFFAALSTITLVLDAAPTRKAIIGWRYKDLANRATVAWQKNVISSTTNGTTGTTQAIDAGWLPAVHVAAFSWGGASLTQTISPGVDEEGTLDFLGNLVVGASTPVNFAAQQRRRITGPHSTGMTMTATSTLASNFVAVQAVWTTLTDVPVIQSAHPRIGGMTGRRAGPPVLTLQPGIDVAAQAPVVTRLIQPVVVGQSVQQAAVW